MRGHRQADIPTCASCDDKPHDAQGKLKNAIATQTDQDSHHDSDGSRNRWSQFIRVHDAFLCWGLRTETIYRADNSMQTTAWPTKTARAGNLGVAGCAIDC